MRKASTVKTADLLDISALVSGWYKPEAEAEDLEVDPPEPDIEMTDVPGEIPLAVAVAAIDTVLSVYPDAGLIVSCAHARIVAGDILVSLAIPLTDPEAESLAWIDAATRPGDGNQWSGRTWYERASDRELTPTMKLKKHSEKRFAV